MYHKFIPSNNNFVKIGGLAEWSKAVDLRSTGVITARVRTSHPSFFYFDHLNLIIVITYFTFRWKNIINIKYNIQNYKLFNKRFYYLLSYQLIESSSIRFHLLIQLCVTNPVTKPYTGLKQTKST